MRKVFLFMMISLDGYFEGINHDLSWHNVDEEFNQFAVEQLKGMDTILFGRKTYEMMKSYWPDAEASDPADAQVAEMMNSYKKIVFSETLDKADWENTTLIKENVKEELEKMKNAEGRDMGIFGSSNLAVSLLEKGLLDELRIMVNPVVIGEGTPLFEGIKEKLKLKLTDTR